MNENDNPEPSKAIKLIRIRPEFFFPMSKYGIVDSGSVFLRFVESVFSGFCFSLPEFVALKTFKDYRIFWAEGCKLLIESILLGQVPADFGEFRSLVDWAHFTTLNSVEGEIDKLEPLAGIASTIYASELCLVDISTTTEHFRQVFVDGHAETPCHRTPLNDSGLSTPYVRLQFIPSSRVFSPRELELEDFTGFVSENRGKTLPSSIVMESAETKGNEFEVVYRSRQTYEQYEASLGAKRAG